MIGPGAAGSVLVRGAGRCGAALGTTAWRACPAAPATPAPGLGAGEPAVLGAAGATGVQVAVVGLHPAAARVAARARAAIRTLFTQVLCTTVWRFAAYLTVRR